MTQDAPTKKPVESDPILQFFSVEGLDPVAVPYAEMALKIVQLLPRNPERTVALRKLLESRECALRAQVYV